MTSYRAETREWEGTSSSLIASWETLGCVEGHGNSNSPKYYSFEDKSVKSSGKYLYRLKQIDIDGAYEYSSVVEINISALVGFSLEQNYPNPFIPVTIIKYSIPDVAADFSQRITIKVYKVLGSEIKILVNKILSPGNYEVSLNASDLASGIYYYRLIAGSNVLSKKMILLK